MNAIIAENETDTLEVIAVQHIIVKNVETEYRHKRLEGREKQ
jgi:hypothetical protein